MTARLVVVTGTGTGIGKTHFSEALLLALGGRGVRAVGLKPVETGYGDPAASDAHRLSRASSFHVKHTGLRFADPVSPHVAAREAGAPISVEALSAGVHAVLPAADVALVELAGGLFTPLSETRLNADLALALRPDRLLLVASDRLGVFHDLLSSLRAAAAMGLPIDGIVLVAPEQPDTSTGRNAAELPRLLRVPLLASLPRSPPSALASHPGVMAIAEMVVASGA
jgi:dethiobiotin synthetase